MNKNVSSIVGLGLIAIVIVVVGLVSASTLGLFESKEMMDLLKQGIIVISFLVLAAILIEMILRMFKIKK